MMRWPLLSLLSTCLESKMRLCWKRWEFQLLWSAWKMQIQKHGRYENIFIPAIPLKLKVEAEDGKGKIWCLYTSFELDATLWNVHVGDWAWLGQVSYCGLPAAQLHAFYPTCSVASPLLIARHNQGWRTMTFCWQTGPYDLDDPVTQAQKGFGVGTQP